MATIKSIEEKAKSFKEALSRAKGFYKRFPEYKEILEKIFPELRESEDERMMRVLIGGLKSYVDIYSEWYDGVSTSEIIAWLEKQGEQKPITHKYNVGATIYYNSFGETKSMVVANVVDIGNGNPMYEDTDGNAVFEKDIIEQKPAWSEEDEVGLGDAMWAIEQARTIAKDENDMGNLWCAERWLKSLKDRVQPQPKKEWSEEDRKIIIELIGIFESAIDGGHVAFPYRLIKDYIRVLKSCLPQSTWKPSDDEMKALANALSLANNCGEEYAFDLRTLQDQLKKLK